MEVKAKLIAVHISPRKIQLIADAVRNLSLDNAIATLLLTKKRGAKELMKTLQSAVANAVHNAKLDKHNLMISRIEVGEGPVLKRFHASTRGRTHPYKKRSSHITVILKEVTKHGQKS